MKSPRGLAHSALPLFLNIATIFMSWKTISVAVDSPHPIMVVVSESMSPAFHRGDVILLCNRTSTISVGDIPVVWFPGNPLPMVHRAIQTQFELQQRDGSVDVRQKILTKGGNNPVDDILLYPPGQTQVDRKDVTGLVVGYIPALGWLTIVFDELPWLKTMLFAVCISVTILGR